MRLLTYKKFKINESRELGAKLSDEIGIKYVIIYRALDKNSNEFKNKDYVTLSKKFAVEHAENNHIVYDEQQHVISKTISTDFLYKATNPGEYFYVGDNIKGTSIYDTLGYDYEGYNE